MSRERARESRRGAGERRSWSARAEFLEQTQCKHLAKKRDEQRMLRGQNKQREKAEREKVERGKRTEKYRLEIAWSNKYHIEKRVTSMKIRLNYSQLQAGTF